MEQTKKLNMTAMSDKTNSNTTAKKEEPAWEHKVAMKVSGVSIAVNLLLSLFKLLAGILAHSGAMISDAIHSASDVGSTFVVIVGVNLSSKKSDKEHQYGHERMECVSSIILSGLLLATGIGIGMNGIENIIKSTSGASIAIPGTLALIAAVVSIVVKEWMFWYTRSAAKKINSGALMADAWHHRSDAMSSVGAFIGILGARLGFPILDPIASVAICVLIVKASVDIFRDAIDKMVDHSCDEATEESMREVIMGVKGVKGIDLLQTRLFGSKMYVDIEISVPDIRGREEILKIHVKNKPLAEDVDLSTVAKGTPGFTGADLENLSNEAALLAARRGSKLITMADFSEAEIKVIAGPEKKSRVVSEHERKLTAYHEAGHAIVMHALPTHDPVHQITIVPRGGAGGMTISLPTEDRSYQSKRYMEEQIVSLLGGRVAEKLMLGDISTGASNDIQRASQIARKMVSVYGMSDRLGSISFESGHDEIFIGRSMAQAKPYSEQVAAQIDEEVKSIVDAAYERCEDILSRDQKHLIAVAEFLLAHETMSAEEFEAVFTDEAAGHDKI